jgi:hypothetical protein
MTSEFLRARRWRQNLGLSPEQLSPYVGYSGLMIRWFEKGQMPPGRKGENPRDIPVNSWTRYKLCCQAAEINLRAQKWKFDW